MQTALVILVDDLCSDLDLESAMFLIFLFLSVAFEIINHDIPLIDYKGWGGHCSTDFTFNLRTVVVPVSSSEKKISSLILLLNN